MARTQVPESVLQNFFSRLSLAVFSIYVESLRVKKRAKFYPFLIHFIQKILTNLIQSLSNVIQSLSNLIQILSNLIQIYPNFIHFLSKFYPKKLSKFIHFMPFLIKALDPELGQKLGTKKVRFKHE
jgi:uncharacterized membrane protein